MNEEERNDWRENLRQAALKTNVHGCQIPPYMVEDMVHYIVDLVPPGHFLTAIFSNNLVRAVERADENNILNLPAYAGFLWARAPRNCWGSPEAMEKWLAQAK